ncbi:MAG: sensor histidine kinase/response regulator hybrid protein [Devosia sp.]|nr:sensor histidine kinase/response regulator hybrid protein [Devosia sp.]
MDLSAPSADQSRLLLDAITDYGIYLLTAEGLISSWNSGARRLKGYEEQEVLNRHFSMFYTEEDLATGLPERALRTAAAEGRFETQGWRLRKDGTRFWANAIIDPIWDESGTLVGFAKVTRDLSEQHQAELELAHSRDLFRRLVLGVTDYALYMLSPDGIVTNWNAGAERIKGYLPDEIIGQHFERFYTPEDRALDGPAKALEAARSTGKYEKEGWRLRKDGSRFMAHVVIEAIRDPDGTLIGFAKITRDITERLRSQQDLEAAREQLLQSQKMEAIGQLTGGVAHDFNNLLMAVLSSLELLQKRVPDDPQILKLIDNARQGAERGALLTRSMLAFARKQDLALQSVDVAVLVQSLQGMLTSSLGVSIEMTVAVPADLPPVVSDPNQLASAVLNLAVNARDAMPDGGAIIISADEIGDFVRLSVSDTGEGMDSDVLARASEPFYTTKGVGKGTGLGLSMVHGMAQQSGGRLEIRSEPGVGTVAEIWLPAARWPEKQLAIVPAPAVPRPGLRILAVDDDYLVLMNTASMLEDLGHKVFEATSGEEALSLLGEEDFDLMITDHAMPKMTGAQLAAAVGVQWPDLRILVATGYAELPEGAGKGLPRLSKPFSQAQLHSAIWDVLR